MAGVPATRIRDGVVGILATLGLAVWVLVPRSSPFGTAAAADEPSVAPAGVENPQRAWQNWTLNCQGCHRVDGTGSDTTAPSLAGTVAKFLWVPGGREYLIRVPGVATSPLSDADLAEVMNWMFWRFDKEHLPSTFKPFTAAELAPLRGRPLRLEASSMRSDLLARAEAQGSPP
jgi:mono/diheme cytochrome c family protein